MIDSLLVIGKDMNKVTGNQTIFYKDHKVPREYHTSEEIDLKYAEAKGLEETAQKEMLEHEAKEEQFILGDMTVEEILLQNNSFDEMIQLDVTLNRSGNVRNTVIAVDVGLQFDSAVVHPRTCKICDYINEIKSVCTEVSVKCNISTHCCPNRLKQLVQSQLLSDKRRGNLE